MLAFDDAALARLAISATRIAHTSAGNGCSASPSASSGNRCAPTRRRRLAAMANANAGGARDGGMDRNISHRRRR
jgi:hypothetical protein